MTGLLLPETGPPLVTHDARLEISSEIVEFGIPGLRARAVGEFRERQPILYDHITWDCNFIIHGGSSLLLDELPQQVFETAAVITERAIAKSGIEVVLEDPDTFNVAYWEAKMSGIPETYLVKAVEDQELHELITAMLETPTLQSGAQEFDCRLAVGIGAGLTRYFLQCALVAS